MAKKKTVKKASRKRAKKTVTTAEQVRAQMQAQAAAILAEGSVLSSFYHSGVAGVEREQPIRRFLSGHLPGRFLVGQGSVASVEKMLTHQHDILVADRDSSVTLLNTTSAQLIPIEALHLIVEVKTTSAGHADLGKSLHAVRKLKTSRGLRQLGAAGSELGFTAPAVHTLVIYEGPSPDTAITHLKAMNANGEQDGGRMIMDFVLVLSRKNKTHESGYLIGYRRDDASANVKYPHHLYPQCGEDGLSGPHVIKEGADSFAHWYAAIVNHLAGVTAYPPILYSYLGEKVEMMAWTKKPF